MIIKIKSVEELRELNKSNYTPHYFDEAGMGYLCGQEYDTEGWKISIIDEQEKTFDIDGWGIDSWMYDVIEGD